MALYKFKPEDLLVNTIKAHPSVKFVIHTGSIIYNNKSKEFATPDGHVSLGELATLKATGADVHNFVTKDSSRIGWKTVSVGAFNNLAYGDTLTSSLPLTASIQTEYFAASAARPHIDALKNVTNHYTVLSPHYAYSSSLGDKSDQIVRLISFPSIFYGTKIKKRTVDLKFYATGSLIGRLQDKYGNGNLVQTYGSEGSGSVAGVVFYNEGFILLTGSWNITEEFTDNYQGSSYPRWVDFSCPDDGFGVATDDSSYEILMSGTQDVPVVTMLAHANKGELNHSNNVTFLEHGQTVTADNPYGASSGSLGFYEKEDLIIKNVAKYAYNNDTGSFRKETYISKVGIYDEEKNLIGIAKLATPVRKRENDQFTFKLKMDI